MTRGLPAILVALSLAFGSAGPASAQAGPPADWGAALREDAQAFHDLVAANHPGPVDPANPGFNARLEAGLRLALDRARSADGYEAWYSALQEYQASFDDGHLTLIDYASIGHVWTLQWPGFITGLRSGPRGPRHEVVFRQDPASPPLGAVLDSCDGRPADRLAEEIVGRTAGRWMLRSRRALYASTVFVDQRNPYVERPRRCRFSADGRTRTYDLAWRVLPDAVRDQAFAAAISPQYFAPIELRDWDHGVWIGLGAFDVDPAGENGQRLTALTQAVEARAEAIRAAPVVVFDLRGNAGGSSAWSSKLARILWGDAYVDALGPRSEASDWRVSEGNEALFTHYRDVVFANDPGVRAFAAEVVDGLSRARAEGRALWRQESGQVRPPRPEGPPLVRGRTYVLTDYLCASACLDAVDLFRAMGAQVVGQETSADTLYMQVRDVPLPSGRVTARIPIKVYRGRARGDNETVVPDHVWPGDLSDTAGIEALIGRLD
jgi:hypothetical protein